MCVFIELVLLPILAGTLANVLSEWLIRFVASKRDKKKKQPERLEQAQKNTTGGNRWCFLICLFHRTFKQVHCTIKKSLCQKYCYCIVSLLSSSAPP